MERIKITQIQSIIDRPKNQRLVMKALGLTRMHKTVEHNATPQILGMVEKVKHLVKVENV
ncbi:MAG: 50S ribosomal protein L30 [Bacteroidales bacterium]|jgi:large subunit ribosomal protein L30|nr:50S ribosomal protein L30 [Bacteroidales bacterium]MBR0123137.1 50S ribosomal protein L30 [Bacteroidales bacterium]MBR5650873.1 50S ribosomal protein L30 [Bacteroidales bacterium]MBR5720533.1 50S ribosomal protein L30 [Bacteroidales bacterium]